MPINQASPMTPPHPAWVFSETRAILFGTVSNTFEGRAKCRGPLAVSPKNHSHYSHLAAAMITRPARIRAMAAKVPHCCQRRKAGEGGWERGWRRDCWRPKPVIRRTMRPTRARICPRPPFSMLSPQGPVDYDQETCRHPAGRAKTGGVRGIQTLCILLLPLCFQVVKFSGSQQGASPRHLDPGHTKLAITV